MSVFEIRPQASNDYHTATFLAYDSVGPFGIASGHITLFMLEDYPGSVKLSNIMCSRKHGGRGTALLLAGMQWAQQYGALSLQGKLSTTESVEEIARWYEKRQIQLAQNNYDLEGYVSGVIGACQDILARHKVDYRVANSQ